MKILSINRGNEFSPNHISNDAAILKAVSEHLQAKGTDVDIIAESELDKSILSGYDAVVNMCRSNSALALLKEFETEGHIVINSAYGIENCIRFNMTKIFMAHGLKHPESILADNLSTLDIETLTPQYPCWIKRGDACWSNHSYRHLPYRKFQTEYVCLLSRIRQIRIQHGSSRPVCVLPSVVPMV